MIELHFISNVVISREFMKELSNTKYIEGMSVVENQDPAIYAAMSAWPQVKEAEFYGDSFTAEQLPTWRELASIRILNGQVSDAGLERMGTYEKLGQITIDGSRLTGATVASLGKLSSLRSLGVWGLDEKVATEIERVLANSKDLDLQLGQK